MPPTAVEQFQDALGELAARSGEASSRLLNRISVLSPVEARAFITDAYPELLTPFLAASSDLTAQWYAEQPTAARRPGVAEFVPVRPPLAGGEQLAISGRWALTQNDPVTALQGSATRNVMNASRDTVILNAQRENVRWVRQAKMNACGFCKMLATRAAKDLAQYSYSSQGVARKRDRYGNPTGDYTLVVIGKRGRKRRKGGRNFGSEYHDHCRCTAVPIRDGSYEPPDYVQEWTEQYDAIVAREGTGDLLKISNLMDVGRVRPDRVRVLQDGADLFTAATATAPPPPVDLDAPAPARPPRSFEVVESEFQAAIEAGDDAAIDRLAGELEAIEAAQRKAADRAAKAKVRREAADRAKWDRVGELVEQGVDPLEAESDVFGRSVESLRRRDFIAQARAEGHQGKGFDQLVDSVFTRLIDDLYTAADDATNGYMLKPQFVGKVRARDLWRMSDARARTVMSEEMAAWFDANGRLTRSALRQSILDGSGVWRDPMGRDFLQ